MGHGGGVTFNDNDTLGRKMTGKEDWGKRAERGFLASGIDPGDRRGHKNRYIDLLQKTALDRVLKLKGDETVLDFGCGSGRISYWIAPRVKKVFGLEVTPEMIRVAERSRTSENVELVLYDGIDFPVFPDPLDLVLSVGVLQTMKGNALKRTLSQLALVLRPGGEIVLIEQASDNPKMGRPAVQEYLDAFEETGLKCLQRYPIRNGRWWLLYLIRYGLFPAHWFPRVARLELNRRKDESGPIRHYKDFLFLLEKGP